MDEEEGTKQRRPLFIIYGVYNLCGAVEAENTDSPAEKCLCCHNQLENNRLFRSGAGETDEEKLNWIPTYHFIQR